MRLFDTHCHFDFDVFADDFACQIQLAKTQGVERVMIPSIGPSNWDKLLNMSAEYAGIYIALGMHPYFLNDNSVYHLTDLQKQTEAHHNHFRAIGECGLDAMVDVDHDNNPATDAATTQVFCEIGTAGGLPDGVVLTATDTLDTLCYL